MSDPPCCSNVIKCGTFEGLVPSCTRNCYWVCFQYSPCELTSGSFLTGKESFFSSLHILTLIGFESLGTRTNYKFNATCLSSSTTIFIAIAEMSNLPELVHLRMWEPSMVVRVFARGTNASQEKQSDSCTIPSSTSMQTTCRGGQFLQGCKSSCQQLFFPLSFCYGSYGRSVEVKFNFNCAIVDVVLAASWLEGLWLHCLNHRVKTEDSSKRLQKLAGGEDIGRKTD